MDRKPTKTEQQIEHDRIDGVARQLLLSLFNQGEFFPSPQKMRECVRLAREFNSELVSPTDRPKHVTREAVYTDNLHDEQGE